MDVVVVGAGFAGLYAIHRLRQDGWSVCCFETGSGVGGTWYWNRYPGARCDTPSLEYSYGFDLELAQEWEWRERYAAQPEILRYLEHVADRFDLHRDIRLDMRVTRLVLDEVADTWLVETDQDDVVRCRFVVMATGCLSAANVPDLAGLDDFEGTVLHTGRWPHEPVDLRDRNIAVVGTGSSGIQLVPVIAETAASVTVFQRTPNFAVPAGNRPLAPDEQERVKADYAGFRERNRKMQGAFGADMPRTHQSALELDADERNAIFEQCWQDGGPAFLMVFNDLTMDESADALAADFVRHKIREIVRDPATAHRLAPHHLLSCKRLCLDLGYFESFNRPNVRLIDLVTSPLEGVTRTGLRAGGELHEFDTLVLATGFDAITGALGRIEIIGRGGVPLRAVWADGPRSYLGLSVPGFPNLFTITGPGSPSVLTNMVVSIEHHVDWIADCLDHLRSEAYASIEAEEDATDDWVQHVSTVAGFTLLPRCDNWYVGANIPGKPRVFMPLPGFPAYARRCEKVATAGYQGFTRRG